MQLSVFSLAMWLVMAAPILSQVENQPIVNSAIRVSNPVVVTITGPGTVLVDWSLANPDGYYEYTVSVYDLTIGQPVTSVITTNLSVGIDNLTSGHTYRFKVEAPSIIIGTGDSDMG